MSESIVFDLDSRGGIVEHCLCRPNLSKDAGPFATVQGIGDGFFPGDPKFPKIPKNLAIAREFPSYSFGTISV